MKARARRAGRMLLIAVLGLTLAAVVINGFTPHAGGPSSSSYSTAADGLRGYAELLSGAGHPVGRLRVAPAHAELDPRATLVVLDPELLLRADVLALRRFVLAGGRLIAGGAEPGAWLAELMPGSPLWSAGGPTVATPLVPVPETAGVGSVAADGTGGWDAPRATLPALGSARRSLLTVASLGAGRLALLADPSPLQNSRLADADNAAFALALAGARTRPVEFEEAVHGYGTARGLAALPSRWKWALIGLIAAALVAVAARFRRLGPPQPQPAATPPPRRAHVEALAAALARTGDPAAATAPVRTQARVLVGTRAGLPADAGPDEFAAAASRLGLDERAIAALTATAPGADDVLAAGRALARLSGPGATR